MNNHYSINKGFKRTCGFSLQGSLAKNGAPQFIQTNSEVIGVPQATDITFEQNKIQQDDNNIPVITNQQKNNHNTFGLCNILSSKNRKIAKIAGIIEQRNTENIAGTIIPSQNNINQNSVEQHDSDSIDTLFQVQDTIQLSQGTLGESTVQERRDASVGNQVPVQLTGESTMSASAPNPLRQEGDTGNNLMNQEKKNPKHGTTGLPELHRSERQGNIYPVTPPKGTGTKRHLILSPCLETSPSQIKKRYKKTYSSKPRKKLCLNTREREPMVLECQTDVPSESQLRKMDQHVQIVEQMMEKIGVRNIFELNSAVQCFERVLNIQPDTQTMLSPTSRSYSIGNNSPELFTPLPQPYTVIHPQTTNRPHQQLAPSVTPRITLQQATPTINLQPVPPTIRPIVMNIGLRDPVIINVESVLHDPITGNRDPVISIQEHVTPNQKSLTTNQSPVTPNQEPMAPNQSPVTPTQEPMPPNQSPVTSNQEPITSNQEASTSSQEPGPSNERPHTPNNNSVSGNHEVTPNQEQATIYIDSDDSDSMSDNDDDPEIMIISNNSRQSVSDRKSRRSKINAIARVHLQANKPVKHPMLYVFARPKANIDKKLSKDFKQTACKIMKLLLNCDAHQFMVWMLSSGIMPTVQYCQKHHKISIAEIPAARIPAAKGGVSLDYYTWELQCCGRKSLKRSSINCFFSGNLYDNCVLPTTIIKVIYHWATYSSAGRIDTLIQIKRMHMIQLFYYIRAVCTVIVHNHINNFGKNKTHVYITTHDINDLGFVVLLYDEHTKLYRLIFLREQLHSAEVIKVVTQHILNIVNPEAKIVCHQQNLIEALQSMNYTVLTTDITGISNARSYFKTCVMKIFPTTVLKKLKDEDMQLVLNELCWRESFGQTGSIAFINMLLHIRRITNISNVHEVKNLLDSLSSENSQLHVSTGGVMNLLETVQKNPNGHYKFDSPVDPVDLEPFEHAIQSVFPKFQSQLINLEPQLSTSETDLEFPLFPEVLTDNSTVTNESLLPEPQTTISTTESLQPEPQASTSEVSHDPDEVNSLILDTDPSSPMEWIEVTPEIDQIIQPQSSGKSTKKSRKDKHQPNTTNLLSSSEPTGFRMSDNLFIDLTQPETLPDLTQPETLPDLTQPETLPDLTQPETLPDLNQPDNLPDILPDIFPDTLPDLTQQDTVPDLTQPDTVPDLTQPDANIQGNQTLPNTLYMTPPSEPRIRVSQSIFSEPDTNTQSNPTIPNTLDVTPPSEPRIGILHDLLLKPDDNTQSSQTLQNTQNLPSTSKSAKIKISSSIFKKANSTQPDCILVDNNPDRIMQNQNDSYENNSEQTLSLTLRENSASSTSISPTHIIQKKNKRYWVKLAEGMGKNISRLKSFFYGYLSPNHFEEQECAFCFYCHICGKNCSNNIKFYKHMKEHLSPTWVSHTKSHLCSYCLLCFKDKNECSKHEKEAHIMEQKMACHICCKDMHNYTNLHLHLISNHCEAEMPYRCRVCSYATSFFHCIIIHFNQSHAGSPYVMCHFCLCIWTIDNHNKKTFSFKVASHLRYHLRNGVSCNNCVLQFTHSSGLLFKHKTNDHKSMASCEGRQTYKASLFDDTSLDKQSWVSKKATDTNNKPTCSFSGADSSHIPSEVTDVPIIRNLKLIITPFKTFFCIECDANLTLENHFLEYVKCNKCSYSTCCRNVMPRHMSTFHPRNERPSYTVGPPIPLHCHLRCLCGISSVSGNAFARHLALCKIGNKTGYPLRSPSHSAQLASLSYMKRNPPPSFTPKK